jgi:hypothetical protein
MIIRAVRLHALITMLAEVQLVIFRMIFKFLPAMAIWAAILI